MTPDTPKYEMSINRLKVIVNQLESGNLGLEDTLNLFNEATLLVSSCQKQLDNAEEQMRTLMQESDQQPQN